MNSDWATLSPFDAAVEYHVLCEFFDRSVCTGGYGKDGVLPRTAWERATIESHARRRRMDAHRRAGVALGDLDEIIRSDIVINRAKQIVDERYWTAPID